MVLVTINHCLPQALGFNTLTGSWCNRLSIFSPVPAIAGDRRAGCIPYKCIFVGSAAAAALVLSEALCLIIYAFLYYHGI